MKIRKLFTLDGKGFTRFKKLVKNYEMSKTLNAMIGRYNDDKEFRKDIKNKVNE